MRTSTRVELVLDAVGAGVDTGVVEAGRLVAAGSVGSGDSVVVVVTDSVLGAVVTGGSLVIVVELGVVWSGGAVLVAVSPPFPHAAAVANNPATRPTRRMRMTPSFSFLFHGRAERTRVPGPNVKDRPSASPS